MNFHRSILSEILFRLNLFNLRLINFLNSIIIKKSINESTVIINTQYVQRYSFIESLFGNFLKHRGYKVKGLVCAGYNYCEMHKKNVDPPDCQSCRNKTFKLHNAAKIESVDLEDYKTKLKNNVIKKSEIRLESLKKISEDSYGYPLGETTYWNWLHYSNGDIFPEVSDKNNEKLLDIYETTFSSFKSIESVIMKYKPKYMVTCHGKFAQTRPAYYLRNYFNYSCLTWENFAMDDSFVWLKNALAMDKNISNYWKYVSTQNLTESQNIMVNNYYKDQKSGANQKWSFLDKITLTNTDQIYGKLNLKKDKIVISIFLQVAWDALGLSHKIEDLDFYEILDFIIKNSSKYENIQFVIRAHPAETNISEYMRSSKPIINTLLEHNTDIPKNVFLVHAESNISSHSLCSMSDEIFFYSSTLGLEALNNRKKITCLGTQSYYSGKGFTNDLTSKKDILNFFNKLESNFLIRNERPQKIYLDDKQYKEIRNLTYFIRLKLHSYISIIKRGIIILTYHRYCNYKKYCENLQRYIEGDGTPFDLN